MTLSLTLARAVLAAVDWSVLHVDGGSASGVPDALLELAAAGDDATAEGAYWKLDNNVVVQGEVFDSAASLVPAILILLAGDLPTSARVKLLDLLIEMHGGQPHPSESARSGDSAAEECTRRIRDGRWLYFAAACNAAASVRRSAVDLVASVETDLMLRAEFLQAWAQEDPDPEVRSSAAWWLRG